jgi:hypothetical protein
MGLKVHNIHSVVLVFLFLTLLTANMAKDTLHKTEISGNKDVDGIQRNVGDTVGDVFATGQAGGHVGDAVDKGVLRGNV